MDRAASDLRLRHRAPRGCDRRRHRGDRPCLRARLLPALAAGLPLRRSRASASRAGDRPAARAARDLALRCPPSRLDPSPHRPRGRPSPLPPQRDPRRTGRARLRGGTAGARSGLSEQALAGLVQADPRGPCGQSVRSLPGELAVVVEDGDHAVFLAADSSYTEDALLRDVVDGVGPDEAAEHLTHERIRAYAAETPTVYLPTHDPETGARLAARQTLSAARERMIA